MTKKQAATAFGKLGGNARAKRLSDEELEKNRQCGLALPHWAKEMEE